MMKRMKRLAAMVLMLALLTAVFVPSALADALYGVIKTPTRDGSVNLRAKAGVTQAVVGWAKNGDEVEINLPANCDSVKVESPNGNVSYLNADGAVAMLKLGEVGGPRCCKRNSYIAITEGVRFAKEELGVEMELSPITTLWAT